MPPYPDNMDLKPEAFTDLLKRLEQIYGAMDRAYDKVAGEYGFHCNGCEDNCCLARFYHHTYLEFLYLLKGYRTLERKQQIAIRQKAEEVCSILQGAERNESGSPPRQMCPLNSDGLCSLYSQRPMICRMHGLPHRLYRPNGSILKGPGCAYFDHHNGNAASLLFDRTPFYSDMARLERELRLHIGADAKIKMTVAEMILSF